MSDLRAAIEQFRDSCRGIRDNYEAISRQVWKEFHGEIADRLDAILAEYPEESGIEDVTLPLMPTSKRTVTLTEEPLRKALKNRLEEASEVIDLLRIGADNETDTVIDCMEAVRLIDAFDAALSRESALAPDPMQAKYATLLAKARRLRAALIDERVFDDDTSCIYPETCQCDTCALLRDTADLEHDMSGPDGPVADSSGGYKIMPGEETPDDES